MDAKVWMIGDDRDDIGLLSAWLVEERELRGSVRVVDAPIGEEQLGSLPDLLTVGLGAGGAGTVLASSLITWLQSRRTSVKLKVEAAGRSVTLDIQTIEDVRPLLEQILSFDDNG
jgi:hypothetical protein